MYIKVKTGGSRTLDRVYAQSKTYYKYLRYGLTFLEFYNEEDQEVWEHIELVRKGLMRVFELKIDYLLQELDSFDASAHIMSQKDCNIRNYIVGDAYECLQDETGNQNSTDLQSLTDKNTSDVYVELCHYVQTDGINVQISWCSSLNWWSIGSYNVSILASKRADLENYPGFNKKIEEMKKHEIRYNYCHFIANAWFDTLDKIFDFSSNSASLNEDSEAKEESEEDTERKNNFYSTLEKWTLVGELVGIDITQQILSYPSQSLIFSSLIANDNASDTWMLPEQWADFCSKYNLPFIPIYRVGFYNKREDLKTALLNLYHRVTSGELCEYEEGSIIMLIKRNASDPSHDKVLSCSKIKTIEYKVFKKIKDKLKHFWSQYEDCTYFNGKMQKEYKTKLDRLKLEFNDILKSHHPFDCFTKVNALHNNM